MIYREFLDTPSDFVDHFGRFSYCYTPSLSFFELVPLGYAAFSVIDFIASLIEEGLKKGIIFPVHTQDIKIDSLLHFT